jgi:drug/metabolite transporter (DMT)-like permease
LSVLSGTLLALVSALSWSFANVFIQVASRRFGSWGALVWAQLIGGIVATVVALLVDGAPHGWSSATLEPLAVASLCAAAAYVGLFESLRRGQVAVVTPIIAAWSTVSVTVGVLVFDAPLSRFGAAGVALVVAGNILLARSTRGPSHRDATFEAADSATESTPRAAIAWAALSMLGFGLMVPAVDELGAQVGRLWAVPAVWAVELSLGMVALWRAGLLPPWPRGRADWSIATRAAVFEVGGFIAISLALGLAPVTVVSPVSSLSTAGSVALGLFLLRERVSGLALAGAVAACIGIVLVNL